MKGIRQVSSSMGYHEPVLVNEVLEYLALSSGSEVWDATVGTGGHSEQIIRHIGSGGHLYCSDRDGESLAVARGRLEGMGTGTDISFYHMDFKDVGLGVENIFDKELDGILVDLGISSYQLSSVERGFGFSPEGILDMRMDRRGSLTASEIVNGYGYRELKRILKEYGEESRAALIARRIVEARADHPIRTAGELCGLIEGIVPRRLTRSRIHPATLTFQALRIAVNDELGNLSEGLEGLVQHLRRGGRLVVISFHSLEDRIVKRLFRKLSTDCVCPSWFPVCKCDHEAVTRLLTRKVVRPGEKELRCNPSSRSARMRAVERIR